MSRGVWFWDRDLFCRSECCIDSRSRAVEGSNLEFLRLWTLEYADVIQRGHPRTCSTSRCCDTGLSFRNDYDHNPCLHLECGLELNVVLFVGE